MSVVMPKSAVSKRQNEGTSEYSAEGSNSDHRVKKDVFTLDYMKLVRLQLNCIGQYPNKEFGINTPRTRLLGYYRWVVIAASLMCEILCITYTWNRRHVLDFFDLGHNYGNIMTTAVLLQRLSITFKKSFRSLLHKFITEYHLLHFESESDFAKEEYNRINKFCRIIGSVLLLQLISGTFTYNLTPVYNNWRAGLFSENPAVNKTLEHSVSLELPFDCTHEVGLGYYSVVLLTFYPCFNVSCGMAAYDTIINSMVFHIWGHLNILAHKLRTFPKLNAASTRQHTEITKDYNKRAHLALKNIIQHYQFIKQFTSDVSDAFETCLCAYLTFHQLSGCVFLLEISALTPEAFGKYTVLTLFVFQQLVQTCMIFEQINSKSEKLASQVYDIPWEDMDASNRRIVLVLLSDVQNSLSVKALGVLPVGVKTMSAIIRTTISYFLLLKTLSK